MRPRACGRINLTGKCLLVSQGMLSSRCQACRLKHEEHINSFSHYTAPIVDGGIEYKIHFVALLSDKPDAVPLVMLHGWPGLFISSRYFPHKNNINHYFREFPRVSPNYFHLAQRVQCLHPSIQSNCALNTWIHFLFTSTHGQRPPHRGCCSHLR